MVEPGGPVSLDQHPLLRAAVWRHRFPRPLGEMASPDWLVERLSEVPADRDERLRLAIRDMLRHGGHKPTGRGKPSSEYLLRAAQEGGLRTINPAVDACNAISLRFGLPISVVDADRAIQPYRIGIASAGARYVFNPSGQEIDLEGLLCLFDVGGPCANAVKDSQQTKTHAGTRRTLTVIWGCAGFEEVLAQADKKYAGMLYGLGAEGALLAT